MKLTILLTLTAVLVGGGAAVLAFQERSDRPLPELSESPWTEGLELLEVHPFTLAEPDLDRSRGGAEPYSEGLLLVLAAGPDMLVQRQLEEHVLQVGTHTVRRFNSGDVSGNVVVAVPGSPDLAEAPAFFGDPALPERLTDADLAAQLKLATDRGVRPFDAGLIASASAPTAHLTGGWDLGRYASELVERYAPDEVDVISGLRAPLIGR